VTPPEHYAALPISDIPAFMRDLRLRNGVRARALEFTVLTALRVGRVIGARWTEIDLDAKVWTIPKELMKGRKGRGREHRVPLSDAAVAIVRGQVGAHAEWVFPGAKQGKHVTDAAVSGLLDEMNYKDVKGTVVDTHGFRSTFRDWASEHTDHSREVSEMALAHTISNQVEAAYRRGDLFEKRRALMNDWDGFCASTSAP
jgi:integrase